MRLFVHSFVGRRFATNIELLVHLANTAIRHSTNLSVNLRKAVDPVKFEELVSLINSADFPDLLRKAQDDPEVRSLWSLCFGCILARFLQLLI